MEAQGGTWVDHLQPALDRYNESGHSTLDAAPQEMTDDVVFRLHEENAEEAGVNAELLKKRQQKLEREGGYRVHEPKGNLKGLRRRIDANTWSREINNVARFPAPGVVEDNEGDKTLTKFAKPVPWNSSGLAHRTAPGPDDLEPFAKRLRDMLPGRGSSFSQAAKEMKRAAGFSDALKGAIWTVRRQIPGTVSNPRQPHIRDRASTNALINGGLADAGDCLQASQPRGA